MRVLSVIDNLINIDATTQDETNQVVYEHAWVGEVPFGLLVLLISLRASHAIKEEAHENETNAQEVGIEGILLFWSLEEIENEQTNRYKEGNEVLL